jgi:hypothetical protein
MTVFPLYVKNYLQLSSIIKCDYSIVQNNMVYFPNEQSYTSTNL